MSVRSFATAAVGVVAESVREAFIDPVQSGRVEIRIWPAQMRATIIGAYVVYALMVLSVLVSPLVLANEPRYSDLGLSTWGSYPLAVGLWASMVLLFLASLDFHILWRLGAWLLLAVPHLTTWVTGVLAIGQGPQPLLSLLAAVAAGGIGTVMLIVLAAIGSHSPIRVATVVLTLIALGLSYLTPQLLALRVPDTGTLSLSVTGSVMTILAMPLAVAAGTAFAQIAINLSTSTANSIRERVPGRVWPFVAPVLGVVVLVMPIVRNVGVVRDDGGAGVLATIAFTVVGTGLSGVGLLLALRRARRTADTSTALTSVRPYAITEILADVSTVLGILLGSWGVIELVDLLVPLPALLDTNSAEVSDMLMATAALVLAVRSVLRGRVAGAVLLPPVAVMGVYGGLRSPLGLPTLLGTVSAGVLAIALGVIAILWWRRGGGRHRWFVLSLAYTILLVFPFREELAEPLEALLGSTRVGVLLVGLIWLLLTEAEFTHRASPRFNRSARTLVFLAYALFTAVMMTAVAYATEDSIFRLLHLGDLAGIGDAVIGFAVAPAVIVGLVALGHRDVDPVDDSPEARPAP